MFCRPLSRCRRDGGARPLGVIGATAARFPPPPVNLEVKLCDSNGVFVRAKGRRDGRRRSGVKPLHLIGWKGERAGCRRKTPRRPRHHGCILSSQNRRRKKTEFYLQNKTLFFGLKLEEISCSLESENYIYFLNLCSFFSGLLKVFYSLLYFTVISTCLCTYKLYIQL